MEVYKNDMQNAFFHSFFFMTKIYYKENNKTAHQMLNQPHSPALRSTQWAWKWLGFGELCSKLPLTVCYASNCCTECNYYALEYAWHLFCFYCSQLPCTPKIEGGQLHGGGAWIVQHHPSTGPAPPPPPPPALTGASASSLRPCFAF